tara:strand:- start:5196 stop:5426 length:231 start_codon:yes stop_codon:yes gene_type:complete
MINNTLIQSLSKTSLTLDLKTKEIFNQIIIKSFYDAATSEEEEVIAAIALQFDLDCLEQILSIIEVEGYKMPFDNE